MRRTLTSVYQRVRNVSFVEDFVYILIEWSLFEWSHPGLYLGSFSLIPVPSHYHYCANYWDLVLQYFIKSWPESFWKTRIRHRCFPVNFANSFQKTLLKKVSGWLSLTAINQINSHNFLISNFIQTDKFQTFMAISSPLKTGIKENLLEMLIPSIVHLKQLWRFWNPTHPLPF